MAAGLTAAVMVMVVVMAVSLRHMEVWGVMMMMHGVLASFSQSMWGGVCFFCLGGREGGGGGGSGWIACPGALFLYDQEGLVEGVLAAVLGIDYEMVLLPRALLSTARS